MPTKFFRHGKALEKLSELVVKAPRPSQTQRGRKGQSERGDDTSIEAEKRVVDVLLDLSVAKGLLKEKERAWHTLSAAKGSTSRIEKEVATLRAGIKSSKHERDILIQKLLRERGQ